MEAVYFLLGSYVTYTWRNLARSRLMLVLEGAISMAVSCIPSSLSARFPLHLYAAKLPI